MLNYSDSLFQSSQLTSLAHLYAQIKEEIDRSRIESALRLLNYTEKILEHDSATGTLNLDYSILTLHTKAYCYSL